MKAALWLAGLLWALLLMPVLLEPPRNRVAEKKHAAALGREVSRAIDAFWSEYERFPAGTNEEIFASLLGQNTRQIVFLDFAPEFLNETGELVDPWGRPFRVTVDEDRGSARVQSAGPDGIFGGASGKSDDYDSARDIIDGMMAGKAAAAPVQPFLF
jgi:hypothetical protein